MYCSARAYVTHHTPGEVLRLGTMFREELAACLESEAEITAANTALQSTAQRHLFGEHAHPHVNTVALEPLSDGNGEKKRDLTMCVFVSSLS